MPPGPAVRAVGRGPPGPVGRPEPVEVAALEEPVCSAAGRDPPLDSVAAIVLAVAWSTSSSSDIRAVSAATRLETPSRMSVSRLIVSECRVDSRFSRRSAPS